MDLYLWLKLGGLCCLFVSCLGFGMDAERNLKLRWRLFAEAKDVFAILEKEMIFHHARADDALKLASGGLCTCLSELLLEAASQIEHGKGESFEQIWKMAVKNRIPKYLLKTEETELLCRASSALCCSDTIMQKTLLLQNQERFAHLSDSAKKEYQEKGSLVRRLSVAGGVFLVILLL